MCLFVVFEGRDKILLDGSEHAKGKNLEDYDDEEEVFSLKGMGDSDADSDSYSDAGNYDSEDASEEDEGEGGEPLLPARSSKKAKPRGQNKPVTEEDEAASDEDVEERWGKSKSAYYSATAQEVDSDDEEARELEEAEALRLQAKAREAVTDDDFGLNDSDSLRTYKPDACVYPCSVASCLAQWFNSSSTQPATMPITAVPPSTSPRDKVSILRQLELTSPEVLALAREWQYIAADMRRLEAAITKCVHLWVLLFHHAGLVAYPVYPDMLRRTELDPDHPTLGMVHLHYQTLLTYATVLAHYLHVRSTPVTGPTPNAPSVAKAVPDIVLERLCQLRHSLSTLEDLGFSALEGEENDDDFDESELEFGNEGLDAKYSDAAIDVVLKLIENNGASGADLNHVRQMLSENAKGRPLANAKANGKTGGENGKKKKKKKLNNPIRRKGKELPNEGETPDALKTAEKTNGLHSMKFDLEEPEFGFYSAQASSSSSASKPGAPYDAFGEQTSLDLADLADKNARKKSLKFHAQKIESTSRRREAARLNALGGDDDIPRRDAKREKRGRERAALEAAKRGERGQGGDDLDDLDPEPSTSTPAETETGTVAGDKGKKRAHNEIDGGDGGGSGAEGEDGYYELVKKSKKQAKIDKKVAYEAAVAASKCVFPFTSFTLVFCDNFRIDPDVSTFSFFFSFSQTQTQA